MGEGARPSGTIAFLFTDVEGSTRLWTADADAMSASLRLHDELMRRVVDAHGGYVFSTAGDSFAVAFRTSSAAIDAARAVQDALGAADWQANSWPGWPITTTSTSRAKCAAWHRPPTSERRCSTSPRRSRRQPANRLLADQKSSAIGSAGSPASRHSWVKTPAPGEYWGTRSLSPFRRSGQGLSSCCDLRREPLPRIGLDEAEPTTQWHRSPRASPSSCRRNSPAGRDDV